MKITLIRLLLELDEPGGVCAPEHATDELDLPLARDPRSPDGPPVLLASSIAGALRRMPGIDPAALFGYETAGTDKGVASPVRLLGTTVILPDHGNLVTRGRNAMDRARGAPRPKQLFTTQQLPAGTRIEVCLRWDAPPTPDLESLLNALRAWRAQLGRGTTIGSGACHTHAIGVRVLDLAARPDLTEWLTRRGPDLYAAIPLETTTVTESAPMLLEVRWRIVDALHIGTGAPAPDRDGRLVATIAREEHTAVVPGSSWKGVLRARCEYILRSLGIGACTDGCCGKCDTCELFGHGSPPRPTAEVAATGRRGRIHVQSSRIAPDPAHRRTGPLVTTRQHVAIDRFTGGVHAGLLYSDEVVVSGTLRLCIASSDTTPLWARGLLLAAVRDIADGLVGIGADTTRGCGTLQRIDDEGEPIAAATAADLAEIRAAIDLLTAGGRR